MSGAMLVRGGLPSILGLGAALPVLLLILTFTVKEPH